jgi:hypothetical protein
MIASIEKKARRIVDGNVQMLVPWILLAACAYDQSTPIVSDATYDEWCQRAQRCWHRITHPHKIFVLHDDEGSQVSVMLRQDQFPGIVKGTLVGLFVKHGVTNVIPTWTKASDKATARAARRAARRRIRLNGAV